MLLLVGGVFESSISVLLSRKAGNGTHRYDSLNSGVLGVSLLVGFGLK